MRDGAIGGAGSDHAEDFRFAGAERGAELWPIRRKCGFESREVGLGSEVFEGIAGGSELDGGPVIVVEFETGTSGEGASACGGVGGLEFGPDSAAAAKSGQGAAWVASSEQDGAFSAGGHGLEHRNFEFCGEFAERLSVTAGGFEIMFRYSNFHTGFEQFGLASSRLGGAGAILASMPTNGFGCSVEPALRKTK